MSIARKRIKFDEFIKKIQPDPKNIKELVLLKGYIGESDLENHIRLYADANLKKFIELPEVDVIHSEPVSLEENPLGGSRVWVNETAVFTAGNPNHANRVKSSFLEGDLIKAFANANFDTLAVVGHLLGEDDSGKFTCETEGGPSCNATKGCVSCNPCDPACFAGSQLIPNYITEYFENPLFQPNKPEFKAYRGGFNPYRF